MPQLYCLQLNVSAVRSVSRLLHKTRDLVRRTEHHIKNTDDFFNEIKGIQQDPHIIRVNLDLMSLFTKLPIEEALKELHER